MLASSVELEEVGNRGYQSAHMGKIFEEGFSFSGFERDKLYLSDRGERFIDLSGLSGLDSVTDGRGAAYGDFDNDGDYDVFLTSLQGQVHHLFKNNVGQHRGFLRVALEGTRSGWDAYGAEVRVKTSQGTLTRIKAGGSGFVSQSDPRLLFGLGEDEVAEWLEVRWPSGLVERFEDVPVGSSVKLVEGQSELVYLQEKRFDLPEPAGRGAEVLHALRVGKGDLFPPVKLIDLEEGETDFHAYRQPGRMYLVNLWATWCVPCRQEMPELQKLYPDLQASGVDLIGISVDTDTGREKIRGFLAPLEITYPIFTTEETAFEQIFSRGQVFVPLSFVVDGEGRITDVLSGWSKESEARIRSLIKYE